MPLLLHGQAAGLTTYSDTIAIVVLNQTQVDTLLRAKWEAMTSRDNYFAEMFRGIGQLMHLVEDLSVPKHTRDDGHYIFYNYEKWVKDTGSDGSPNVGIDPLAGIVRVRNSGDLQGFTIITPVFYDSSAPGNPNPLAPVPFANLFDTRQYIGSNPNITLQGNIGLSEYTNANYISPDSMFTDKFPYPAWSSITEYDEIIDSTIGKKRTYLKKLGYSAGLRQVDERCCPFTR